MATSTPRLVITLSMSYSVNHDLAELVFSLP